ncbi:septum formation initiator family protein [Vitreoscilla massiliensis]|uniref:Cell division protein FtsB n=1 Tax=Vitreoscilla massiliensis TaxID=1689272 RepID=A0ABY4E3S6_9NEIS|nr:septum formation initiator family protein [Vitreoscilla massiliensis]UOO90430.1 septum formation initiator family protein [Vitreoscilla massiliensis]
MKWVTLVLLGALAYVHFHLWVGDEGWFHQGDLKERLQKQLASNEDASQRNSALKAELGDLHSGGDAIGELARYELGYVGEGETFYRIVPKITTEAIAPVTEE